MTIGDEVLYTPSAGLPLIGRIRSFKRFASMNPTSPQIVQSKKEGEK